MANIQTGLTFTAVYEKQQRQHQSPTVEKVMEKVIAKGLSKTYAERGIKMTSVAKETSDLEKYQHCGYLRQALQREQIEESVQICVDTLKGRKFDTIAFRGMSGVLIAPIVAHILKKEIIVVRKSSGRTLSESSHSTHKVEGHIPAKRYVVLDDFISGGSTVREIISEVNKFAPSAKLWGGVCYTNWKTWLTPKALRNKVNIL